MKVSEKGENMICEIAILIDVHDFGICKLTDAGSVTVYLVQEEDGCINWYINPDEHSDEILLEKNADYIGER